MKTKVCTFCKIKKSLEDFYRDGSIRCGRKSYCKACASLMKKKYYRKHPGKRKEEYKRKQNRRRGIPELREKDRKDVTKSRYGLSEKEIEKFSAAQRGGCDICGNPETMKYQGITKLLSIDHNHITNKVRGILCQSCNSMLGYAKADRCKTEILLKAISYLERAENG